eukprot:TRINITY_DN67555_c8_g1_i3.p1 TRINITY_DN67555_c8_g1~~TRINITY_DN67555_c8_g1_i3.p1  ORF type:complete len:166 (-),score=6.21 TRINITY_DN67555_c8_g1_i3:277-726(-)
MPKPGRSKRGKKEVLRTTLDVDPSKWKLDDLLNANAPQVTIKTWLIGAAVASCTKNRKRTQLANRVENLESLTLQLWFSQSDNKDLIQWAKDHNYLEVHTKIKTSGYTPFTAKPKLVELLDTYCGGLRETERKELYRSPAIHFGLKSKK